MKFPIASLLASTLIFSLPSPAQQAPERFSVATGKALTEGEKPAGEAVMTVYHPEKPNGAAVVIYPGGGYTTLVVEPEGHRIAKWFGEHGITGAVVEYRLPNGNSGLPLADAKSATRIVRLHATEWKLDPKRVGNIGFSAGGHLAATAATHFDKGDDKAAHPVDKLSSRPDFSILIYPVITMGELTHGGSKGALLGPAPDAKAIELFSNEKQVTRDTPPTFLVHAEDDTLVVPANSELYYDALRKNKVPAEYLKLPSGGHGINGYQGPLWEEWKSKCLKWLAKEKFIPVADAK
ncbi:alpha/beta hydrolase [Luteolibacter yonseiensis]|uniref:Alpha/beta hydrolase n=1 Tax=Luteolibacter yonseiensis TaxID=1144680 RepID=A0A934R823_9BACT|nr:alpha/beta hydrolase [Luteolibacter yonseiensis]MBK1817648.1 alpha/beta hydrolase [Luteolibacter yonseiensis]